MNITQIFDQYKINYSTGGQSIRAGWIGMDCPWCRVKPGEKYLGINLQKGYANCWRCGPKRIPDILVMLAGIPLGEAITACGGIRPARATATPRGRCKPPLGVGPLSRVHREYLESRGFDVDQVVDLWGLQGIGLVGRLKWRIFIPITRWGEMVSWTTRSVGSGSKRYHGASPDQESASPKSLLYGSDYARHAIVIVEGPADAWAIGPGAVATLGINVTPEQIAAAANYPVRVVCFDVEQEAQRRAGKLAGTLSLFPGQTHVVTLETGKDAASADPAEISEIRRAFLD